MTRTLDLHYRVLSKPKNLDKSWFNAEVCIAEFREEVLSDATIWGKSDYLIHWKKSRERLLEDNRMTLFCSCLSLVSADLWVADPNDGIVTLYNVNTKYSDVVIRGPYVSSGSVESIVPGLRGSDVSKWNVIINN